MATKTAVGTPEEGPKKKGYGIPDKDKKGLKSKTNYKSINESHPLPKSSGDKDYNRRHPESNEKQIKAKPKTRPHEQLPDTPKGPKKPTDKDYNRHPESMKHEAWKKPMEPHTRLKEELKKKSSSVKVVKNAIKKPEDKEKANKLKKTASRSKTQIRTKKGKK